MGISKTLYDRLGGKDTFIKVHKIFYDKAYAHPWLGKYFTDIPQDILKSQQTNFMVQLMGGPKAYSGRSPKFSHQHMMITEELFNLRSNLLSESIKEAGIKDELREEWIAADGALKKSVVKKSEDECSSQYTGRSILNFSK